MLKPLLVLCLLAVAAAPTSQALFGQASWQSVGLFNCFLGSCNARVVSHHSSADLTTGSLEVTHTTSAGESVKSRQCVAPLLTTSTLLPGSCDNQVEFTLPFGRCMWGKAWTNSLLESTPPIRFPPMCA